MKSIPDAEEMAKKDFFTLFFRQIKYRQNNAYENEIDLQFFREISCRINEIFKTEHFCNFSVKSIVQNMTIFADFSVKSIVEM